MLFFFIQIWDSVSGGELLSIPHKHIVKSVHFSLDSTHLATGSNEKLLRIWDLSKPDVGECLSVLNNIYLKCFLVELNSELGSINSYKNIYKY